VRFIKLSPRLQAMGAFCLAAMVAWVLVASTAYLTRDGRLAAKQRQLTYTAQELDALVSELERLESEALERTRRLEQRQTLLESLVDTPEKEAKAEARAGGDGAGRAGDRALERQSFARPAPAPTVMLAAISGPAESEIVWRAPSRRVERTVNHLLDRLEGVARHQKDAAQTLAQAQKDRLQRIRKVIERVGLAPEQIKRRGKMRPLGMGGPTQLAPAAHLEPPAFSTLQRRLRKRRALLEAAESLPSRPPAEDYYLSSRFGPRRDPFTNQRSHHSGLDLAGWRGETIYAAAGGRVVEAGREPAYGRMVEIDHGAGFVTRYGHMHRLQVKAGEHVDRGETIGEMGSTGRSTSTHLHWEVWFEGEPIDPLPFIKAADDVYALQRRSQKDDEANAS